MNRVIFFDSTGSVDDYLKTRNQPACHDKGSEDVFVALTPIIGSYARKRSLAAESTLSYFSNRSHESALECSKVVMEWFESRLDFIYPGAASKRAFIDSFKSWSRFSVHHCIWAVEIILNAAQKEGAGELGASLSGSRCVPSLYLEPEEKCVGSIARLIADTKGIGFEDISKGTASNESLAQRKVKHLWFIIRFMLTFFKFEIWETGLSAKRVRRASRPLVLYTSKGYNLNKLADLIKRDYPEAELELLGGPVISTARIPSLVIRMLSGAHASKIIEQKRMFDRLISEIEGNREIFSYRGISFSSIIAQKVRENLANYMVEQMVWSLKLDHFLDYAQPKALMSNGERHDDLILADICNKRRIPAVLISHGSHVSPKNEYEMTEWGEHGKTLIRAPFHFVALQTPMAAQYLNTFYTPSIAVKTGPLIWGMPINDKKSEELRKTFLKEKYVPGKTRVILHAGSPKRTRNIRFYVYETMDEYIDALAETARVVEKVEDMILIVKFRPRSEIDIDSLKERVPFSDKVMLSVDEPFLDMLGIADILMSFSSTTIEEALQNRLPVLLYGGKGRYQHIKAFEIRPGQQVEAAAVYHASDSSSLDYALRNIPQLHKGKELCKDLYDAYIYPLSKRDSLSSLIKRGCRG